MAHFQERRAGRDRRQNKGQERRKKSDRRDNTEATIECVEHARFKAWMVMTDKSLDD